MCNIDVKLSFWCCTGNYAVNVIPFVLLSCCDDAYTHSCIMSYRCCEKGDYRFRCWWPVSVPSLMLWLGARCGAQGLLKEAHEFIVDWDSVRNWNHCWDRCCMHMSLLMLLRVIFVYWLCIIIKWVKLEYMCCGA